VLVSTFPIPSAQGETLGQALQIVLLVLLLLVLAGILYRRYLTRRELMERARELEELGGIGRAIASAPPEPDELAEVAYQEAARLLATDFFQLGVFEGDTYRTLIWVRDGERQENQSFPLTHGEDGLVGWVRRNARPLLVRDFEAERKRLPAWPSHSLQDPPVSGVFVPLLSGEEAIGVMLIQSRKRRAFREHDTRLLTILANAVASTLVLANLRSQLEFRTLQLVLIREISRRLASLQPLRELFTQVASLISETLGYHSVRLYESLGGELILRAASEEETAARAGEDSAGLAAEAATQGRTLHRTPSFLAPDPDGTTSVARAEVAVPLMVEDRVLGVLHLCGEHGRPIPSEHVGLAETLAAYLAIAALEARNFASQQEEAWITTVLLEVARHAAQPGGADEALQAVLQLTTLLAGTPWAILLQPHAEGERLAIGLSSGIGRQTQDQLTDLFLSPAEINLEPPFAGEAPFAVALPDRLSTILDTREATAVTLSDGRSLLGVLLIGGQGLAGRRLSLLVGIAHQISLRLENTRLIEEVATRRSLERELATARQIQVSFLPNVLPSHPDWEVGTTWRVARDVGGDFYDFIPLPPGPDGPRWGIVIADVADKGVPAALFMALCRTLMRSAALSRTDPGVTLARVNEMIFADAKTDLFVSIFYAVWEPSTGKLAYANGGHNPPLLIEPERPARRLTEHGMVLGVSREMAYQTRNLTIPPGALLVLYTDGVTEAMDSGGQFFGLHRLENLVLASTEGPAQKVADAIAERVSEFCAEPDLSDDLTAVVLRRVS
jgi:serine phosphatase RsbU (regulator of sigma subunit)/transcriptional regulator with GAF, ATPase, and Fis domain